MGRRKKPTEKKVLEGTFRKDRDGVKPVLAALELTVPNPPKHLRPVAKSIWVEIAPLLVANKTLHRTDWYCLEAYCLAIERLRRANEEYNEEVVIDGAMGGKVKNPALSALREAEGAVDKFGAKLGLDPSARSSLNVGEGAPPGSDLAKILQPRRKA